MEEVLKSLKIRCRRTILRKLDNDEITYDTEKKIFLYKDTEEEYKAGGEKAEGSDSDEDHDESDKSDDDQGEEHKEPLKASKSEESQIKEQKVKEQVEPVRLES